MVRSENRLLIVVCLLVSASGCGTLTGSGLSDLNSLFGSKSNVRDEEDHRQRYQKDRNPADLRWLLANRIESGMSVTEVSRTIGEDGRRVYDDNWIKTGAGYYQNGDKAWKWDPDRNGQSLILVFRDGLLVNFDPSDYEKSNSSYEF